MFCDVAILQLLRCVCIISVAFHHVVSYAGCLGKRIDVLLVLDWIDLLVIFIGFVFGFEVLVAVEGEMGAYVAVAETPLLFPLLLELVRGGLHTLL